MRPAEETDRAQSATLEARRALTKTSPATATGAHVGIGHVTRDVLLRDLDRTELASGLANRCLGSPLAGRNCCPMAKAWAMRS